MKKLTSEGDLVDLTPEEIAAKLALQAEAEAEANSYITKRRNAYASLEEQLDMQYHDRMDGTTTWEDHITSIKTQFPKP